MKTILLVLAIHLAAYSAHAGGDLVNNGGGIAEKNVMFAYQRLENYLRMCLNSEFCKLDQSQKQIIESITKGIEEERRTPNQIQFVSEKNFPGTFIINREVKVAKTGSRIGSPIFINTDLLYTKNELGYFIPVSLSEAVAILVHELGHHYGDFQHAELDLIGVRVAMLMQHKTYSTPLLPWSAQISAMVINPDLENSFPEVLLYVEDQVIDISQQFKDVVYCPKFTIPIPILPIPDIPLRNKKPLGSLIHNVHWNSANPKGDSVALTIQADLSHRCKDSSKGKDMEGRSQDFKLEINFSASIDKQSGKWILNPNSIKLAQKHESWWKFITLPGLQP